MDLDRVFLLIAQFFQERNLLLSVAALSQETGVNFDAQLSHMQGGQLQAILERGLAASLPASTIEQEASLGLRL